MRNLTEERTLAIAKFRESQGDLGLSGDFKVIPFKHVITAKITGTTIEMIETSTNKKVGIQSFDGDQLPSGKPFILSTIKAVYANEATADAKTVANADYSDAAPASLLNGEYTLKQQDRGNLVEGLTSDVFNVNTTNNNLDGEYQISDMPLLKDKSSLEFDVKIPEALASGSEHFVRFEWNGHTIK